MGASQSALPSTWSAAKLLWVLDAGYAACEPGTIDALVAATDRMREYMHCTPGRQLF